MKLLFLPLLALTGSSLWGAALAPGRLEEIVQRSVEKTNADWAAAPQYNFTERDIITKRGKRTDKTYRVMMIEGSPYYMLLASGGESLSPTRRAAEDRKRLREIDRRRAETPDERQKRIANYQGDRRQNHALMQEMVKAFQFKLLGEDTMDGRRCFVLEATPRSDYDPPSRNTKVLKGMRGKMWIDAEHYQWIRVQAEVFRSVTFGLFIAHVRPGTEFVLEQRPVAEEIWLPIRFSTRVKANLLVWSRSSTDDEVYSDYRHIP